MNGKQKIFICFAVCLFVFIAGGISGYFCGRENDSGTGNMADQYRKEIADSNQLLSNYEQNETIIKQNLKTVSELLAASKIELQLSKDEFTRLKISSQKQAESLGRISILCRELEMKLNRLSVIYENCEQERKAREIERNISLSANGVLIIIIIILCISRGN